MSHDASHPSSPKRTRVDPATRRSSSASDEKTKTGGETGNERGGEDSTTPTTANEKRRESSQHSRVIKIGSRNSPLALWQSNHVKALLEKCTRVVTSAENENADGRPWFEICDEKTYGDKVLDRSLVDIGSTNPGLFTKELEVGLLEGRTRLIVHSLKDMPTDLPEGLILACITERSTVEDCVLLHPRYAGVTGGDIRSLADLPAGAVVGTSSLRREALLRHHHPHLVPQTIRGNVQTRLRKLTEDGSPYACIIMAKVGLERVELADKIAFTLDSWPYCVSQGALGIEAREDDVEIRSMLEKIEHKPTAMRCLAERSLLNALEGGCQIAMGVRSSLSSDNLLNLYAIVLSKDGKDTFASSIERRCESKEEARALGQALATQLRDGGAEKIVGRPGRKRPLTYGNAENPQNPVVAAKMES